MIPSTLNATTPPKAMAHDNANQVQSNTASKSESKITISDYLLRRIQDLGVKDLIGVPGDFNLHFLDYVMAYEGVSWIGSSNELNAGYAADGYSRAHGIAALLTTYGVGELSAMNAIAGAFAEQSPIVHIVGYPSSQTKPGVILHHSLGKGLYTEFYDMYSSISVARILIAPDTTAREIDRVFETAYKRRCPVYIGLPMDLVHHQIAEPSEGLSFVLVENEAELEQRAIREIVRVARESERPVILLDAGASRDEIQSEVEQMVRAIKWPCFVTTMGKGSVNEQIETFAGCYVGGLSFPNVQKSFESADCVLSIGLFRSDLNTGFFSEKYAWTKSIELHDTYTIVHGARYNKIGMKHLIPALIPHMRTIPSSVGVIGDAWYTSVPKPLTSKLVNQDYLWRRVSSWIKEGDVLYAETGTSSFGLLDIRLPPNVSLNSSYHWASIGHATAAMCGAVYACGDRRRVVGFLGDGSFQLTFQEISILVRRNCSCTIFVIDNSGYSIERFIRGTQQAYNDIHHWNYENTFEYFGGKGDVRVVESDVQLDAVLSDPGFGDGKGLKMCVVRCEKLDGPRMMLAMANLRGRLTADGKLDENAP